LREKLKKKVLTFLLFRRKLKVDQDCRPGLTHWSRSYARDGMVVDHEVNLLGLCAFNPLDFSKSEDIGDLARAVDRYNVGFRGQIRRFGPKEKLIDRITAVQDENGRCFCYKQRLICGVSCSCGCRYCIDMCPAKGKGYLVDRPNVSISRHVYSDRPDPTREALLFPFDRTQVCEIAGQVRIDTKLRNDTREKISKSFRLPGEIFRNSF
jgi:hypothetical protein